MALSGIKVSDEVKNCICDMRVNRTGDCKGNRIRVMTLKLDKEIEVDQIYREDDLKRIFAEQQLNMRTTYEFVCHLMKEGECNYIMYDCHYKTDRSSSDKEDLVFIMWVSDNAPVKKKMSYASSISYLKKLAAAKHDFEFHSRDEISKRAFAKAIKKTGKCKVCNLEGDDVSDDSD